MEWINREIDNIPRQVKFPLKAKMLYYCRYKSFQRQLSIIPLDIFEVSIRLEPQGAWCNDIINGNVIKAKFPHMVWKMPGKEQAQGDNCQRDTIAFAYDAENLKLFRSLGMFQEESYREFTMTPKIESLIHDFCKALTQLYTPGMADHIDWLCFQLYREIFFARTPDTKTDKKTEIIKNISVWFQLHHTEAFSLDDVANTYGLSHTMFFNEWKRLFKVSPLQYIIDHKIHSAINLLLGTSMPIAQIVKNIKFSSSTAFHKRFYQKIGMTPGDFRKRFPGEQFHCYDDIKEPMKIIEAWEKEDAVPQNWSYVCSGNRSTSSGKG